jgi:hypothetical protein
VRDPGDVSTKVLKLITGERAWTSLGVLDAQELEPRGLRIAPRLETLVLYTVSVLAPQLLVDLPALTDLTLGMGELPDGMWDGARPLRRLAIWIDHELSPEVPPVRQLELHARSLAAPWGAWGGVGGLESLRLQSLDRTAPAPLDRLGTLRRLKLDLARPPSAATLAPLVALESIDVLDVPVGDLPAAPLRRARVTARTPADVSLLLERYAALDEVELVTPDRIDVESLQDLLRARGLTDCRLEPYPRALRAARPAISGG